MVGTESDNVHKLLATLPAGDRVKRYREIAAEAFHRAEATDDEVVRAGYLSLASGWQVLALEIEHSNGLTHLKIDAAQGPTSCAASVGATADIEITQT